MDSKMSAENIQEPVANLDCSDGNNKLDTKEPPKVNMVTETSAKEEKISESALESPVKEEVEVVQEDRPLNVDTYLHLEPDVIVGAALKNGEFVYLIKWKDCEREDLVPSSIASVKWPEIVLEYFEAVLNICPHNEENYSISSYDEDDDSDEDETMMD